MNQVEFTCIQLWMIVPKTKSQNLCHRNKNDKMADNQLCSLKK